MTLSNRSENARDFIIGLARYVFWGMAIAFAGDLPFPEQGVASIIWVILFLVFYGHEVARPPLRLGDPLARTTALIVVAVSGVIALSELWSSAFFTRACAATEWFTVVPVHRGYSLLSVRGIILLASVPFPFLAYSLIEEFTFRRWLFHPLMRWRGVHTAVVITSLLFALAHLTLQPGRLILHFGFGVMLAYLVLATGSLWSAIVVHTVWNAVAILLYGITINALTREIFRNGWVSCGISGTVYVISSAVVALVIISLFRRNQWSVRLKN